MKHTLIPKSVASIIIAAALLTAAPATVLAQAKAAPAAPATAGAPSQLVLTNSARILDTLEARRGEFTKNRGALQKYVSSEFDQIFDRDYAARLVLGTHGRGASEADIKLFADALADSLMQRYGSALLDLNAKLKVRVKSETALRGGAIVKVSSEYLRPGAEPVPIDYMMRKVGPQWKAFDVMVEGVSFVQTFRTQFDAPLKRKSIAQVAADLRAGKLQTSAN